MRENKGGISLFQKEISLPLTHPEKIALPACSSKECGACGMMVPAWRHCFARRHWFCYTICLCYYYPLPLCQSSVGADYFPSVEMQTFPVVRTAASAVLPPSTGGANKRGEQSNAALVGTCKADNIRSRRKLLKTNDTQAERHPQGVCRIRKAAKLPTAAQQRVIEVHQIV